MMALTAPDWLTRHDGSLRLASDGHTWFVMLGDQPQYALSPIPVAGKDGCAIRQTNNGRRIECSGTAPSAEERSRELSTEGSCEGSAARRI